MQLDDLIREERLDNIISKTHVSKGVIDKLLNREFDLLKKPQAIGAIAILEREYGVELNELREECLDYFELNISNDNKFIVLEPAKESQILPKLFVIVLLASLIYSAWYFFGSYYKPTIDDVEPKNKKTFIDIIIEGKDSIIDKVSGKSTDTDTNIVQVEITKESDENDTKVNIADKPTIKERDQIAESKIPQKSAIEEKSEEKPEEKSIVEETTIKTADIEKTIVDTPAALKQPTVTKYPLMIEKPAVVDPIKSDNTEDLLKVKRSKITLLPQKTMWFELVDLDTKKVLKYKRKDQYDIDVKDHRWLFASKDTVFAFIDNDIFEEYGGEGQIFFRLDKNGIHPLTEDEYEAALK